MKVLVRSGSHTRVMPWVKSSRSRFDTIAILPQLCSSRVAPSCNSTFPPTAGRRRSFEGTRHPEEGSITIFVVAFCLALLAAAGLVVDGGAKLRAARQASATAEEAARAGAGRINVDRAYAHGGRFVIDRNDAVAAARAYLTSSRTTGTVTAASPRAIRVTVTISKPTALLSLIGIGHVSATKTATADLVQGIETPGP